MPGIPAGSTVQITFEYSHFLQTLMNVVHYTCETESSTGTIASESQALADYFGDTGDAFSPASKLKSILPSSVVIRTVRAQVIHPVRYAYRFKDVNDAGVLGPSPTANIDVVITKRTDSSGRGKQSDFYLPGLTPENMVNGVLTDLYTTDVENKTNWLHNIYNSVAGGSYHPVIFKRSTGTVTPITSRFVHTTVRCMTRRTVGRGI